MTPKEKAMELINKFWHVEPFETQEGMEVKMAIDCALISVDEILKVIHTNMQNKYWEEVKQELAIL
jgi:hypothetical protein